MDKIYVNRMEFYGYHGVFQEETRLGQRFAVDLTVEADLKKPGRQIILMTPLTMASCMQSAKRLWKESLISWLKL